MRNIIRKILKEVDLSSEQVKFQEIYSDYWDKMLRQVCLKYTNDLGKAEDYCQNGFMKIYQKLPSYDGKGSIEGWVRMVIKNSIIDEMRKRGIKYSGDEPDWSRVDVEDGEYEKTSENRLKKIEAVLPKLTPMYRKVFELYYFKNMTHKQIADKLGISEGTSKSNLAKAKRNIKSLLEKFNSDY